MLRPLRFLFSLTMLLHGKFRSLIKCLILFSAVDAYFYTFTSLFVWSWCCCPSPVWPVMTMMMLVTLTLVPGGLIDYQLAQTVAAALSVSTRESFSPEQQRMPDNTWLCSSFVLKLTYLLCHFCSDPILSSQLKNTLFLFQGPGLCSKDGGGRETLFSKSILYSITVDIFTLSLHV